MLLNEHCCKIVIDKTVNNVKQLTFVRLRYRLNVTIG